MGKKLASRGDAAVTVTTGELVDTVMSVMRPKQRAAVRKAIRQLKAGPPPDSRRTPNGRFEFAPISPELVMIFRREGSAIHVSDVMNKQAFEYITSL